ncbi:MAG: hypothetical protein IEMM0002_0204 [bacterium]|nr:MAG: hypothetical protein IEMM0002_0204 [bacterium]
MTKGKFFIHAHHISSHFTNGLTPVGALLLTLYYINGNADFEVSSFYCFFFTLLSAPFVFFSGFIDWKKRFKGRSTMIFNHKRVFGILLMVILLLIVVWRVEVPNVAYPESYFRYLYLAAVYTTLGFATYLGHLGGKFV